MFGVLLLGFWPTLLGLPATWSASYQEHGFFVAGLSAWLIWHHRGRLAGASGAGLTDLLPIVGLLSVAWLLAVIMNVRLVQQLLLVCTLAAWALVVLGPGARGTVAAIGATFLLAVPFWGLAAPVLQRATVIVSGGITRMAGIDAVIGYDTISLTTGTFLVEEGCAGLNYLMGGLTLGAFYAHLFTDRWQTQVKIVGLAGAAAIVGNWIRVTFLVFVGEATAMQSPMLEDHLWQGWMIFTLLMIPAYFGVRYIERRDAARTPGTIEVAAGDAGADVAPPTLDELTASEAEPAPASERAVPRFTIAAWATGVALVGPILLVVVGLIPRANEPEPDVDVFDVHAAWSVERASVGWTPDFQGFDDRAGWRIHVQAETLGDGVEAARYYFRDQRQGAELIGYPNAIAPDSTILADRIVGPIGPDRRLVNEVVFMEDGGPRVAWYWYRVAGFQTPFANKAKLLEILAFFRRSAAAELIVMSMACMPESCGHAAMTLRAVVAGPAAMVPGAPEEMER